MSQQQRPTQRTDGVKLVDGHSLWVEAVDDVLEALGLDVEEGERGGAAGMDAARSVERGWRWAGEQRAAVRSTSACCTVLPGGPRLAANVALQSVTDTATGCRTTL